MILLITSSVLASHSNYSSLEFSTEISSSLYPIASRDPIDLKDLQVNLTIFPKSEGKRATADELEISVTPETEIEQNDNSILFHWTNPTAKEYRYNIRAGMKTTNTFNRIKRKISFPGLDYPEEYGLYANATEFIDINAAIRNKANEIAGGQTDYYKVIHSIAVWVKDNIQYNLSSLTEDAVQKSSWVFENKVGVCDEITNLYISMLRSLKIPAKFIGGQVYLDSESSFGNHGWAEVYYPGEGWIPVDVTFGEIGWINPTHLKFKESLDSGEPSVGFSWQARNVETFRINPLTIDCKIKKRIGKSEKYLSLLVEPLKTIVGESSYVPIQVSVINPNDYYVPAIIRIIKAPEVIGSNSKSILLWPFEEKELFWTIKIPTEIEKDVIYTTTIEAETNFGTKHKSKIQYEKGIESFSKQWAEEQIKKLEPRSDKEFFPNVKINCSLGREFYYKHETADLHCNVQNIGNIKLTGIRACRLKDCHTINLHINEDTDLSWGIPLIDFEDEKIIVSAESKNMIKHDYVKIKVLVDPNVYIKNFSPTEIEYNKKANFSFLLDSNWSARDIKLEIGNFGHSTLNTLYYEKEILIPFNSKELPRGKVNLILTYHDLANKKYTKNLSYNITITNKPWFIRFILWLETHFN
ncbi:MAG: transglutaminase-like domain-containing protein [Nanoarchaeota archaeon]|nr:transglutaminase-like domain-containing protein [Nanoarchaeota archaeon]